jgi:hypothetical protein
VTGRREKVGRSGSRRWMFWCVECVLTYRIVDVLKSIIAPRNRSPTDARLGDLAMDVLVR